jgi:dihydroxyacetone kinase
VEERRCADLGSIAMKILGAAAARDYEFEKCVEIGKAVNEQLVSIGSVLDHCHVPGRQNHDEIGEDVVVIGAGIHNEPVKASLITQMDVSDMIVGSAESLTVSVD